MSLIVTVSGTCDDYKKALASIEAALVDCGTVKISQELREAIDEVLPTANGLDIELVDEIQYDPYQPPYVRGGDMNMDILVHELCVAVAWHLVSHPSSLTNERLDQAKRLCNRTSKIRLTERIDFLIFGFAVYCIYIQPAERYTEFYTLVHKNGLCFDASKTLVDTHSNWDFLLRYGNDGDPTNSTRLTLLYAMSQFMVLPGLHRGISRVAFVLRALGLQSESKLNRPKLTNQIMDCKAQLLSTDDLCNIDVFYSDMRFVLNKVCADLTSELEDSYSAVANIQAHEC